MNTPIFDSLAAKLTIEALDWEHVPVCEAAACPARDHAHDAQYLTSIRCCGRNIYRCQRSVERQAARPGNWGPCEWCGHQWPHGTRWASLTLIYPINNK